MRTISSKLAGRARAAMKRLTGKSWSFLKPALGAAGAMVLAVFLAAGWLGERSARMAMTRELEECQRRAAAETRALEARAEAAVREAEARHTRAMSELHTRRRHLEREAQSLRARLSALESQDRVRAEAASTLGSDELTRQAVTRLGPGAATPAGQKIHDSALKISNAVRSDGENPDSEFPRQEGVRKAKPAFSELEGCLERAALGEQLISNCEARVEAERAAVAQLERSVFEWQEAARLKDELAAQRDREHQVALRAARGSRWQRFTRAVQYVAVGVVVGVLAR